MAQRQRKTKINSVTFVDGDGIATEPEKGMEENADYQKDLSSILLLMFLYILQGIPLGLAGSIPMMLQQRDISYKDQATFSLAFWPFSIKILWAPIVDSCFWQKMGRRKSWLIPTQYLIGLSLLVLSANVNYYLGQDGSEPHVVLLTSLFFAVSFLAATQDIAVDGWALTMLSRGNIGWASTCNSVGQSFGYFLGYVVFLALESKDFCVNYLLQNDSLVTLPGFLWFWGIVFIVTTTLVWVMKKETNMKEEKGEELELGIIETYKTVFTMMKMYPIRIMIGILLTARIGFACGESLIALKLTEAGVPKDRLALLSIPLTPISLLLPLYISKYTTGPRPLDIYMKAYLPRLLFEIVFAVLVFVTPLFKGSDGYPSHYYVLIVLIFILHQIPANCMFVSQMAFFAKVSDPKIGGTYMTLLNTFTNLGGNWPTWVALRYVSELSWASCSAPGNIPCYTGSQQQACTDAGGSCITSIDGFYVESVLFLIVGLFWYKFGSSFMKYLQDLPSRSWKVAVTNERGRA